MDLEKITEEKMFYVIWLPKMAKLQSYRKEVKPQV